MPRADSATGGFRDGLKHGKTCLGRIPGGGFRADSGRKPKALAKTRQNMPRADSALAKTRQNMPRADSGRFRGGRIPGRIPRADSGRIPGGPVPGLEGGPVARLARSWCASTATTAASAGRGRREARAWRWFA